MMNLVFALLLGLAHGVSDGSAGLLVGAVYRLDDYATATFFLLLYNGLAFACQPAAGLLIDRFPHPRAWLAGGLALTAGGLAVSLVSLPFGLVLAGLGSAWMHAAAGALSIASTPRRATGPGLFAAFGVVGQALGIGLGATLPSGGILWLTLLPLGMAVTVQWRVGAAREEEPAVDATAIGAAELAALVLILAIALRSLVWTGTQVLGLLPALWLALAAGTGKLLGGFAADFLGWRRWTWIALGAALLAFVAGSRMPALVLVGVSSLQSLTPLSIAALGRLLPGRPALAASLALGLAIALGGAPFFMAYGWFDLLPVAPLALAVSAAGYVWALWRVERA